MQETSPVGNGPATDSDSATVEQTVSTPTKAPEPTKVPSQNTPGPTGTGPGSTAPTSTGPGSSGPGTPAVDTPAANAAVPSAPVQNAQQFPPTLVGLDPPTLPASDGMLGTSRTGEAPHREVDARGPADLPQFRPFPHPQRSEPGHPGLRRLWKRLITFWRRTKI